MKKQMIKDIIETFVKAGTVFSAFDVTKELRKQGVYCIHNTIKPNIHSAMTDVMTNGAVSYGKTLVDVGKYSAFIYHPVNVDHTIYTGEPTVGTAQDIKTDVDGLVVTRDKRGRVCVPAKLLRDITAQAGDIVYVGEYQNSVYVTKTNSVTDAHKKYKVDRDNNVRISPQVINSAGLTNITDLTAITGVLGCGLSYVKVTA